MGAPSAKSWLAVVGVASLAAMAAACGQARSGVVASHTSAVELGAATNAIEVVVPTPARYVQGSDGHVHLEYDLVITDVMSAPVTLVSLEVRSGDTTLLQLDTDALKAVTAPFLSAKPTLDVAPSASIVSLIDVILPTAKYGDVPRQVTNELTYSIADDAPFRTIIRSLTTAGPTIDVGRSDPVVVEAPLRSDGWLAFNACCTPNAHRSFLLSSAGSVHAIEMFAIDWVQLVDGQPNKGDGTALTDFYGFGQTVYSATDGKVVSVRNDQAEAPLNESGGGNETVNAPDDYGGNNVVVKISDHQYALYAHMKTGSVLPQVGDRVKAGDPIGQVGNSGNSTVPHLHFGIQETADAFASNSVPYVIKSYTVTGIAMIAADGTLTVRPVNLPQRKTLQLANDIVDFGD
jgi:Peptidase family M23